MSSCFGHSSIWPPKNEVIDLHFSHPSTTWFLYVSPSSSYICHYPASILRSTLTLLLWKTTNFYNLPLPLPFLPRKIEHETHRSPSLCLFLRSWFKKKSQYWTHFTCMTVESHGHSGLRWSYIAMRDSLSCSLKWLPQALSVSLQYSSPLANILLSYFAEKLDEIRHPLQFPRRLSQP